jgi:type IV fimbrial biogenesis protein FimT
MKHASGFTLPELLVVLAIISVSITIAAPAYSEWAQQTQSRTVIGKLARAISHARNIAITHNSYAVICASSDNVTCSSDWTKPLIIFIDKNRNGRVDNDERLLSHYKLLPEGAKLTWRGFGSNRYIRYRPTGLTDGSNGSITYCARGGKLKHARQIIIARGGRLRFARDSNNDGIREDRNGNALGCG